jgi:hypothetical protein
MTPTASIYFDNPYLDGESLVFPKPIAVSSGG